MLAQRQARVDDLAAQSADLDEQKRCAQVGSAKNRERENLLQRNSIPDRLPAAEEGATRDPHAVQKCAYRENHSMLQNEYLREKRRWYS